MLHAVVMAGGSGTRFWPKSRRNRPKQLLCLHGGATMLQQTVDRVAPRIPPERILVVTGADQAAGVRAQLPRVPAANVVSEPCPRDTAACVGLAAEIIARRDPDATMIVMPADHVIQPAETFLKTVDAAVQVIDADPSVLVTFGVRPTRPETGYGYIERGELLDGSGGVAVNTVVSFHEKPKLEVAEGYLKQGNFAWNAGIFLWRARTILDALARRQPSLAVGLREIGDALGGPREHEVLGRVFGSLPKLPIDKAVMEPEAKAGRVRVLEVVYDWNDVGDWRALASLVPPDAKGNSVQGPVHLVGTKGSIVIADDGHLIATLGVEDLVIVQSAGATLVARKDELDKLKGLVEGLEAAGFGDQL